MKKVTINVTEDIINNSTPLDCNRCMVAVAARKAGLERVYVNGFEIHYGRRNKDGYKKRITLPTSVVRNINKFDAGKSVKPFKFDVNLKDTLY